MPRVELIYDTDCPNIQPARKALLMAFVDAGLPPSWLEWGRQSPESPDYVRAFGSPTILVDGRDVAGATPGGEDASCRLYRNSAGAFEGAPSAEAITKALRDDQSPAATVMHPAPGWRSSLAAVPAIAFAFFPKFACPACWPAYAGLLSSAGLGFLLDTAYLFPLTAVFLILAVAALAYRARTRRGYGPFAAGLAAAAVILAGKFIFDSNIAMYGGIGLLIIASVWNAWPKRKKEAGACPACVDQAPEFATKHTMT